jgi:hypothetical protein
MKINFMLIHCVGIKIKNKATLKCIYTQLFAINEESLIE